MRSHPFDEWSGLFRSCGPRSDGGVDGFERGDLTPYTNTVNWAVTTTAIEGTYSGQADNFSADEVMYSMEGDGLDYYPERGDQIAFQIADLGGQNAGFLFGFEVGASDYAGNNGYWARICEDLGEIHLCRLSESIDVIASQSITTGNDPYLGEVKFAQTGSPIEFTVSESSGKQLGSISAADDTFSGRGTGWSRGRGNASSPRFDNAPGYSS